MTNVHWHCERCNEVVVEPADVDNLPLLKAHYCWDGGVGRATPEVVHSALPVLLAPESMRFAGEA
ncbi:MAG TPA: hypothetical protein VHC69_31645 [Polyangiaceae bacterium]|nr:hypothetical protein [Polyangiaceae bacterium]